MRVLAAACFAAGLLGHAPSANAQKKSTEHVELRVGEQRSISARGVKSYSEGTAGIADVRLTRDEKRFIIVGKKAGQTSILLFKRDNSQVLYKIRVKAAVDAEREGRVGKRYNVRLDLYFVLVSDSYSHQIGVGWPASIGQDGVGNITAQGQFGGQSATNWSLGINSALPRLDLAQDKGWLKIYRQAALITANNSEAKFSGGGEVNVRLVNNLTVTIRPIEFGTFVTVRPKYDPQSKRVELNIDASVADLTNEVDGVPGRLTSEIKTLVNLQLGQSVVLGGLVSKRESRSRAGFPGLSQVPFVGALFGSHGKQYEESEMLIFMVPSLVTPVSITSRNRIDEALRTYEEFRGGVDEVELVDGPRAAR